MFAALHETITARLVVLAFVSSSLLFVHAAQPQESRHPDGDPEAITRAETYVARTAHLNGFTVLSAHRRRIPELGEYVDYIQLTKRESATHQKLLLPGATEAPVSRDELEGGIDRRLRARYGKLTPDLHTYLAHASPGERLLLKVWGRTPTDDVEKPIEFADGAAVDAFLQRHHQNLKVVNMQTTRALRAAIEGVGRVVAVMDHLPIVLVDLAARDVSRLEAAADVTRIALAVTEKTPRKPRTAGYKSFYDADDSEVAEIWAPSVRGTDIRVGVIENANYCGIWDGHPGFVDWRGYQEMTAKGLGVNGCTGQPDGTRCPADCSDGAGFCRGGRCFKDHATLVASKLGSVFNTEVRNASELRMYFANDKTDVERLDWFADNKVTVINHSASLASDARDDMNYLIRNQYITVTAAAGNSQAEPVDCYVNAVCVGSYSIVQPGHVDHWKTDPENATNKYARSGSTSFINDPSYPDAEKPDVVGNGEASLVSAMATPAAALWNTTDFGTSFAAPMVGGLVAVLQEYWPTAKVWPEVVRPMLMVSARAHNIEGVQLSRNDAGGDEWDGAGVPTASTLRTIISNGNYRLLSISPADFNADGEIDVTSIFLGVGATVRIVAGWMYCVDGGKTFLATDLDLYLVDKAYDRVVDVSASYTNSLEMLEYRHSGAGRQFTVKLKRDGAMSPCGGRRHEYVGIAWAVY